jgi:hypothetical protein
MKKTLLVVGLLISSTTFGMDNEQQVAATHKQDPDQEYPQTPHRCQFSRTKTVTVSEHCIQLSGPNGTVSSWRLSKDDNWELATCFY